MRAGYYERKINYTWPNLYYLKTVFYKLHFTPKLTMLLSLTVVPQKFFMKTSLHRWSLTGIDQCRLMLLSSLSYTLVTLCILVNFNQSIYVLKSLLKEWNGMVWNFLQDCFFQKFSNNFLAQSSVCNRLARIEVWCDIKISLWENMLIFHFKVLLFLI